MEKINAVITGVGGYVPDYILTNDEISKMVDTNDEWIMTRIGVKERHILNEEGLGTSYMARKAAKQLMQRTGSNPDDEMDEDAFVPDEAGNELVNDDTETAVDPRWDELKKILDNN